MRKKLGVIDAIGLIFLSKLVWLGHHDIFLGDAGLGWHFRAGEWIAEKGSAPQHDPFLFLSGEKLWVHNQWLSDLLLWVGLDLGGLPFLVVFGVGLCLIPYFAILAPLVAAGKNSVLAIVFGLLVVLLTASIQWFLRPVILSFLCFAIVYRICYQQWNTEPDDSYHRLYFLPPLFLVWANLHPAFVLGFALLAAFGAASVLSMLSSSSAEQRRPKVELAHLGLVGFVSLGATLVNPYMGRLHSSIFSLVGSEYFMNLNREWLPPDFSNPVFWPFALLVLILLASLLGAARTRVTLFEYLVLAGLAYMSFQQRRYIPFFALASCVPVVKVLDQLLTRFELPPLLKLRKREGESTHFFWSALLWFLTLAAVAIAPSAAFPAGGKIDLSRVQPTAAVAVLQKAKNRFSGRVFASPDLGGYLIWKTWPEKHIYIDDRNVLNGEARYLEYFSALSAEPDGLNAIAENSFEWILIHPSSPLAVHLRSQGQWSVAFEENRSILFQRVE